MRGAHLKDRHAAADGDRMQGLLLILVALFPTFLAVLCAYAWWHQAPSGDEIDALPIAGLMLCTLGVRLGKR